MKNRILFLSTLTALIFTGSTLFAQHGGHGDKQDHGDHKKTEVSAEEEIDVRTVTGEIIDITCYLRHDSHGEKHIKCGTYCANLGMPLGLLEDETDKVYLIVPPGHEDPKGPVLPYMGKKVTVDAILYTMGGLTGLEIEKIQPAK